MHELSIAQSLVDQIDKNAKEQKAIKVSKIAVCVGRISGVEIEALRFAFPMVVDGTPYSDTILELEEIPFGIKCTACSTASQPVDPFMICPSCGSDQVDLISGRELHIKYMEIEKE